MRPASVAVLTFNVNGIPRLPFYSDDKTENMAKIGRWLMQLDPSPDIICLQEVWTTNYYRTLARILKKEYKYSHFSNGGLALFSKFQVMPIRFSPFRACGDWFNWNCEWISGKGVMYARINIDQTILHLYNTHLHANYDPGSELERYTLVQSAELLTYIRDQGHKTSDKIIICGDLNMGKDSPCYKFITRHFHDSTPHIVTYDTCNDDQLDYILHKNCKVKHTYVLDSKDLSDHRPLFVFLNCNYN
jgi:exonuclease III